MATAIRHTLTQLTRYLLPHGGWRNRRDGNVLPLYDRLLLWLYIGLSLSGFIMVTSASMSVGERLSHNPFYFALRSALFLALAFIIAVATLRVSMAAWQRYSSIILLAVMVLLTLALIVGSSVNGASRWLPLGPLRIQPAELAKLALFCYLASYLVRKVDEVRNNFWGFCKPMSVMVILAVLLLAQPDLGTVVVLFITTLALLFLAGARLWQFLAIIASGLFAVVLLVVTEPYRMRRITSFLDPWQDPYGSGYQLTQSLMAFGRGDLWGQGLGNSIQKLAYLPEAHTDFIFSIVGEELGYLGAALLLLALFAIALRAMLIGRRALQMEQRFAGFLGCAIGVWFSFQTLINVGAAAGVLPTKGLTLPFLSYGGSSLLVMSTAVVFLLRIDHETRLAKVQAVTRGGR